MTLNVRQKILGAILLFTLALSLHAILTTDGAQEDTIVEPVRKGVTSVSHKEHSLQQVFNSQKFPRSQWVNSESDVNLFPAIIEKRLEDNFKTLQLAEEQTPSIRPAPTAPPLPFTYLGKMIDGALITVFVSKNGRNLTLKGGETIEGLYAVKSIDAQKVVFEYIPLNLEQILSIRG